jgi:uncharacterized membrane protein
LIGEDLIMSYPAVISELAGAVKEVGDAVKEVGGTVNSVINVIAWSVLKILPVLVAMLIALVAIDIVLGPLFDDDGAVESPFLSSTQSNEVQFAANAELAPATDTAGALTDARP